MHSTMHCLVTLMLFSLAHSDDKSNDIITSKALDEKGMIKVLNQEPLNEKKKKKVKSDEPDWGTSKYKKENGGKIVGSMDKKSKAEMKEEAIEATNANVGKYANVRLGEEQPSAKEKKIAKIQQAKERVKERGTKDAATDHVNIVCEWAEHQDKHCNGRAIGFNRCNSEESCKSVIEKMPVTKRPQYTFGIQHSLQCWGKEANEDNCWMLIHCLDFLKQPTQIQTETTTTFYECKKPGKIQQDESNTEEDAEVAAMQQQEMQRKDLEELNL